MRNYSLLAGVAALALMTSGANAADVYTPEIEPIAPVEPYAEGFSWQGFYIGATGGYGWGDADYTHQNVNFFGSPGGEYDMDVDGWTGGVIGGFNYQFDNNFVIGVEGTVQASDINGNNDFTQYTNDTTTDISMLAGVAARLGYAVDRALFYGKAGYMGGQVEAGQNYYGAGSRTWSDKEWANGWQVGVGVDYALTDRVFVGVDYTYVDLGSTSFSGDDSAGVPASIDGDINFSVVSARLGFKF